MLVASQLFPKSRAKHLRRGDAEKRGAAETAHEFELTMSRASVCPTVDEMSSASLRSLRLRVKDSAVVICEAVHWLGS